MPGIFREGQCRETPLMPTSSLAPSYSPSAARLILKAICITFHPWLKWLLVFYRISPKLLSLRVKAEVRTQASRPISAYTYVPPPHTYTDTHTHTCSFICALHLCTHQPCRLSARCQLLGLGISSVRVCTHACTHTHVCAHTRTCSFTCALHLGTHQPCRLSA